MRHHVAAGTDDDEEGLGQDDDDDDRAGCVVEGGSYQGAKYLFYGLSTTASATFDRLFSLFPTATAAIVEDRRGRVSSFSVRLRRLFRFRF